MQRDSLREDELFLTLVGHLGKDIRITSKMVDNAAHLNWFEGDPIFTTSWRAAVALKLPRD